MRLVARNWTPLIHAVAIAIALSLLASLRLLWLWNTIGHDLLGGPKAQIKHAAAFLAALVVLAVTVRHRRR